MKVKDFLNKYNLKTQKHFDRTAFCFDMVVELKNTFKNEFQSSQPVKRFELAVNTIKDKWDSIFNKAIVDYKVGESLWKYFYATKIIPLRNELFPDKDWKELKHDYRYENDPEYRRKHETWKRHQSYEEYERKFINNFFNSYYESLFNNILSEEVNQYKNVLGISSEVELNKDLLMAAFRNKSKTCHPDKGGNNEDFIKVTEAKDKLLSLME